MKWFIAVLAVLVLVLQYRIWVARDGVREVLQLRDAVAAQQAENARLQDRNRQLAAEVRDLKQGFAALEEQARSELGLISSNETYYQVVPPQPVSAPVAPAAQAVEPPLRTAAR
jgi:cell division protein FtsB